MIKPFAFVAAAAMLAACGGGGGASAPAGQPGTPGRTPQSLGITFTGTQTLAAARAPRDLSSTPVTVSVNGTVVGSGTLDGSGHAKITFSVPVAPGTTITVVAGRITVTATLATTAQSTAVLVTVKADGTVSVSTSADPGATGQMNPNDPEHEDEDEDGHGNVTSVTASGNVLPANAPFTFVNACGVITLTPTSSAVASIKFEEKGSDDESDDAARFRFEGAFTGALQFPALSSAARVHIEIFDAQHRRLIEVKAPLSAFTSGSTPAASPCPSPTASPAATPTASPTASPAPTASPTPSR
jgi:hypothetical protein